MDDDQKKRPGKGSRGGAGASRGPSDRSGKKPYRPREGGKPFAKRDGAQKPRAEGEAGERKPYRAKTGQDRHAGAGGERRPYAKPDGKKPFRRDDGERTFRPRGEDEGARPADGGSKPKREWKPRSEHASADGAPKREYRPRGESGPERKPFRKDDRAAPAARREGEAPSRTHRGDRPFTRKPEGEERGRRAAGERPFGKQGDKPFARKPRGEDGPDAAPEPGERIAKRLARAGISSRREAEAMIAAGRVRVNGQVLNSPAVNVTSRDMILVDSEPLPAIERTRLFLFHKPAGVVTTNRDPEGRRTIFDVLPEGLPRLVTIGRLDINTEGLLLLTNDGGLARVLELPATGWLRRYRARVHGKVDETALRSLKDGIAVDGVFYGSIEATLDREQGSNAWLTLGLREGKNREVKNVLGALGLDVSRLIRVSYGPFQLGELPEGAVQELKGRTLREQLGERLIEEAGADFEAPVAAEFPNRPVTRGTEPPPRTERPRREEPGEGGLIRNRKREREYRREDALGRLQTKPSGRGGKPMGKKERAEKPYEPPRSRSSNVWMAPGARPQRKKDEMETPSRERADRTGEGQRRPRREDAGFGKRPSSGERGSRASTDTRPTDPNKRGGAKGRTGTRKPPRKDS